MPASQDPSTFSSFDIPPESELAIRLYFCGENGRHLEIASYSDVTAGETRTLEPLRCGSRHNPAVSGQLTLDKVLAMRLEDLNVLQERVSQMEMANYALLTRIYGRFPANNQPFSLLFSPRVLSDDVPASGSAEHRELLFSQYKRMLAIARDPPRSVDVVEPATARGAKALQDYQMQLTLLAEQRKVQMKRKRSGDGNTPYAGPPRFDNDSFRAMRDRCNVIDLEPRPDVAFNYRNDYAIGNNTALTDYQEQLRLLEEQNKKRLLMAKEHRTRAKQQKLDEDDKSQQRSDQTRNLPAWDGQTSLPYRNR